MEDCELNNYDARIYERGHDYEGKLQYDFETAGRKEFETQKLVLLELLERKKVFYNSQKNRGSLNQKQYDFNINSLSEAVNKINSVGFKYFTGGTTNTEYGYYAPKNHTIYINKDQDSIKINDEGYDYEKLISTLFHEIGHAGRLDFNISEVPGIQGNFSLIDTLFPDILDTELSFEGGEYSFAEVITMGYSMISYIYNVYGKEIHEVDQKLMDKIIDDDNNDCLSNPDLYRLVGLFKQHNSTRNLLPFLKGLI